jgi:hypothetical protein
MILNAGSGSSTASESRRDRSIGSPLTMSAKRPASPNTCGSKLSNRSR